MPRQVTGLTAAKVRTAAPGRYGDGNGLFLLVRPNGSRFWLFRYRPSGGKMREMGLGRAGADQAAVPLIEAREKAATLFKQVRDGIDPLAKREADEAEAAAEAQRAKIKGTTFRTAAETFITANAPGWRNPKHRAQWTSTLETYAHPHMGDLPVGEIGTEHVLAALEPIWQAKPETATRVRGRIEAVLDYAKARGWRSGDNPAAWKGHLALTLPARAKVAAVKHHAALPWAEIGAFLTALDAQVGIGAKALQFVILTAARSGEVRGARWCEIDLKAKIWTIPAERMKAKRQHRVPLSVPSLALLADMENLRTDANPEALIFPGASPNRPLSDMSLTAVLRRMKRGDLTAHGFRSTFRDWAGETTNYPREVVEAALAHTVGDKTEAAYARGDLFEKRRLLMDGWAAYALRTPGATGTVSHLRPRDTADTADTSPAETIARYRQ
jgi:integrase